MVKIGITGCQGFIGGAVSRFLSGGGHETLVLDGFTRHCKSVTGHEGLPRDLDWVLHFGATTSIPLSFQEPFFVYANNTESTIRALQIACASSAPFLFMSSYVYGQPHYLPIDESHPVSAVNPYMGSKIISEDLCRQLGRIAGIPVVILRGFYIYGDCRAPGRLISDLLDTARSGSPFILQDPAPRRDYLYIKDFVALVEKIISRSPVAEGTYNVGSGETYSNLEVAQLGQSLSRTMFPIEVAAHPRKNDITDISVNTQRVRETFSWEPRYSLAQGLRELLNHETTVPGVGS